MSVRSESYLQCKLNVALLFDMRCKNSELKRLSPNVPPPIRLGFVPSRQRGKMHLTNETAPDRVEAQKV